MFRQQRISLFIIVLGLLIAIGTGLKAHWFHDAKIPDLNFKSSPEISCNIDGYTFTHTRETYSDGVVYTDGWWRRPLDPEVKIEAETHGAGWAHVLFYGNIDGTSYRDATNPTSEQLGSWVGFLPVGAALDREVEAKFKGSFNSTSKTYSWNASGSIKLVPVYWKWRISGITPGGSWEEASSSFHRTGTDSESGSWTVAHNWTTLNRASPGNRNSDETSSSGSGSSGDSSSESSSSGASCSNHPFYDHCTDTGSCTTRSPSGVPGPDCGYNYCCCAPIGSPTDTGDSSDSSSGSSSSSGCSNNAYYDHCTDTGSCTTGSGSGVPGPECGHNFCCCP